MVSLGPAHENGDQDHLTDKQQRSTMIFGDVGFTGRGEKALLMQAL
jgi:hypothetical protein